MNISRWQQVLKSRRSGVAGLLFSCHLTAIWPTGHGLWHSNWSFQTLLTDLTLIFSQVQGRKNVTMGGESNSFDSQTCLLMWHQKTQKLHFSTTRKAKTETALRSHYSQVGRRQCYILNTELPLEALQSQLLKRRRGEQLRVVRKFCLCWGWHALTGAVGPLLPCH